MKRSIIAVAATLATLLIAVPRGNAVHNGPDLSEAEVQCQLRSQYIMGSFTRRYAKCLLKCAQRADSRADAAANCPEAAACSFGLANATCRCLLRAREQAVDGQVVRCDSDCPECYADSSCNADATAKTDTIASWAESLFFSATPALYCDDSASVDGLHPAEAKCQQTTAKALAFFARAKTLCLRKCRLSEHDGSAAIGSCNAPLSSNPGANPTAEDCIGGAEAKALLKIEKRCNPTTGNPPECWSGRTGPEWVDIAEQFVDDGDPSFFCASPSPAFLDEAEPR
jgi:hypothetical protein